ncbi:CD4-1 molecule isoform X1 [Scleropages formosus]|uniref:CD4-1 molecule isoform X1 n=1 Tax=Scleropages formosus TaxID=113540 RepID=UPI0010FABF52|nr:T-cell surface glycoprotein CD4-like isoform X1 [Scleropages formosus]
MKEGKPQGTRCEGSDRPEDKMKTSGGLIVLVTIVTSTAWTHAAVDVIGQEGHSVTLDNGEKTSEVTWSFRNDEKSEYQVVISATSSVRRSGDGWKERVSMASANVSLIIKNLKKEDFAFFRCKTKSGKETVYRLYSATVVSTPGSTVLASQSLSLRCEVDSSLKPTFEWLSPQNQRISETSNTLTVPSVTLDHSGSWTCVISLNGRKANIFVSVSVADINHPHHEIIYTSVSSTTLPLRCFVSLDLSQLSSVGLQEGHWSFRSFLRERDSQKIISLSEDLLKPSWEEQQNKNWIISQNLLQKNLSIARKVVLEEDAGLYTCALKFKNDIIRKRTVQVEVLRASSSRGLSVPEGQEVNLTCTLSNPLSADLHVEWIPPSKSSLKNLPTRLQQAHLTIHRPTTGDQGKWKCELKRGTALVTSVELLLKIEKVPVNMWLLVSICGAVVAFLLLSFLIMMLIRQYKQVKDARVLPVVLSLLRGHNWKAGALLHVLDTAEVL